MGLRPNDEEVKLAQGTLGALALSLERCGGIPEAEDLKMLMFFYERSLRKGFEMPQPPEVNCLYSHIGLTGFPGYENFKKLGKKIAKGIRSAFMLQGESPTEAERYMESWRFTKEFRRGEGRRYFFINEGVREETRKEVSDIFSKEEAEKLRSLGEILLPYKNRISAPVEGVVV